MQRTPKAQKQSIPWNIKMTVVFLCGNSESEFQDLAGYVFNFKGQKLTSGYFCKHTESETVKTRFMAFYDFKTKQFTVN